MHLTNNTTNLNTSNFTKNKQTNMDFCNNNKTPNKFSLIIITTTTLTILFLLMINTKTYNTKTLFSKIYKPPYKKTKTQFFVESKLKISPTKSPKDVPKIAYLLSGSRGDGDSLKRVLMALYHPLNQYVVHLDLDASLVERLELVDFVEKNSVFKKVGNVRVMGKSNLVTYRGPTMVTNTLHAMAILMKHGGVWDWFVNLSASDYPLVTQDDLLHVLSSLPRELNFIEHTSDIGWKEFQRARPVIIDLAFYASEKSDVYWISEQRGIPSAFKLYTGSAWMMLTRPFVEYCLWGWDNLPRTILMYYTNFLSSPEGYFHTVICNVEELKNTTVNHDLHFISWDTPPKQHPHFLTNDDYQLMVDSNAPFARKFGRNESVLDKIDSDLLRRESNGFSPGNWLNSRVNATELKPGPGADRLKRLVTKLMSVENFHPRQCTNIPL